MQHATLSTQPATLSIQVHALAKKHNLGHKSQGSEKAGTRFLTVFKKGGNGGGGHQVEEAEVVEHHEP